MAYNFITKKYIYEQLRKKNCHPKKNKENYVNNFRDIVLQFYELDPVYLSDEAAEILKNEGQKFFKKMSDKYRDHKSRYSDIIRDEVGF